MKTSESALSKPVRVGLIGAGRIGTAHAEILARRVPSARLIAIADPRPGAAEAIAARLGTRAATDPDDLFSDPEIEAVVIAASSTSHSKLILAAIAAGKAVFCEKPMAETLEDADRAIAAAKSAGLPLQVGFNRRFAPDFREAHDVIIAGGIGTPQLMRSTTRDPGLANPGAVPPWTIFTQTLIHDFDTINWLNPGAEPVEVYATADALVAPDFKEAGLLDTAVVLVKFENGAIATTEASFSAVYGYDVRAEVFGSGGMVSAGDTALTGVTHHTAAGRVQQTVRSDVNLFRDAYAEELASFVDAVRAHKEPCVTGVDARRALAIALASIESYKTNSPVLVHKKELLMAEMTRLNFPLTLQNLNHMNTISQSVAWWCFVPEKLTPEQFVSAVADAGYKGIELVPPQYWSLVIDHGLALSAIAGHQPLTIGLNRRDLHDRLEGEIKANIENAKRLKIPNLICFSGNRNALDDQAGAEITAEGFARVAPAAENAGVTLALELLNSKVDHPDYQADHTAWGVQVCRAVASPRVKLVYDVYHMQVMEGDVIRTIRSIKDYISYYHTAGNPGRNDLDEDQELFYPAILRAIKETGHTGYVTHEFIPKGDPIVALKAAFHTCAKYL